MPRSNGIEDLAQSAGPVDRGGHPPPRGGAIRPSFTSLREPVAEGPAGRGGTALSPGLAPDEPVLVKHIPAVVVVSADPERRERWAAHVAASGAHAIRCAGPEVSCALFAGRDCPLLDEASVAIYDAAAWTPRFRRALQRRHARRRMVVAVATERDGRPEPFLFVRDTADEASYGATP